MDQWPSSSTPKSENDQLARRSGEKGLRRKVFGWNNTGGRSSHAQTRVLENMTQRFAKRFKSDNQPMKLFLRIAVAVFLIECFNGHLVNCLAQGNSFTYQGRLNAGGAAANGSYDMAFTLFNTKPVALPSPGRDEHVRKRDQRIIHDAGEFRAGRVYRCQQLAANRCEHKCGKFIFYVDAATAAYTDALCDLCRHSEQFIRHLAGHAV